MFVEMPLREDTNRCCCVTSLQHALAPLVMGVLRTVCAVAWAGAKIGQEEAVVWDRQGGPYLIANHLAPASFRADAQDDRTYGRLRQQRILCLCCQSFLGYMCTKDTSMVQENLNYVQRFIIKRSRVRSCS